MPGDDGHRDWSYASASQGWPATPEAKKEKGVKQMLP